MVFHLEEILVRPIRPDEEQRFQELMQTHHYLGALPKIGETLRYVALWRDQWIALLSFSSPAWKCAPRDRWIGWTSRLQYDRLKLITNNSRFLILPEWHLPNLGSRVLSLCQHRLNTDWLNTFGHPLLLLETFVDPQRFHGTLYKANNWIYVGNTQGFRRTRLGYSPTPHSSKMVFLKPLHPKAQTLLSQPILPSPYHTGGAHMKLRAQHMQDLPSFFAPIPDPRRPQGRRHRLSTILALAVGATLCGMRGYQAFFDWAQSLSQKARERFGCSYVNGQYIVPSVSTIRQVLTRVDPSQLDQALQRWNETYAQIDTSLAIDGKTMRNAIDDQGRPTHVMSVVGHQTQTCYTQKKWDPSPPQTATNSSKPTKSKPLSLCSTLSPSKIKI